MNFEHVLSALDKELASLQKRLLERESELADMRSELLVNRQARAEVDLLRSQLGFERDENDALRVRLRNEARVHAEAFQRLTPAAKRAMNKWEMNKK